MIDYVIGSRKRARERVEGLEIGESVDYPPLSSVYTRSITQW